MTLTTNVSAYADCYKILDKAVESERGIEVAIESQASALYLIYRLNHARRMQRKMNKDIFPITDKRHYETQYDRLIIRRPTEWYKKWWVRIEPTKEIPEEDIKVL